MNKFILLAVLTSPLVLSACQSPGINPVEQRIKDDAFCQDLGLIPRTGPYNRCRAHRAGVALDESDQRRRFLYGY
jgi:hypothetical protein